MNSVCPKCGGEMQAGMITTPSGASLRSSLVFVLPGQRASWNPIKSFQQGLADEPGELAFPVKAIRCAKCGYLEHFAVAE